jgi:hypothetical protein
VAAGFTVGASVSLIVHRAFRAHLCPRCLCKCDHRKNQHERKKSYCAFHGYLLYVENAIPIEPPGFLRNPSGCFICLNVRSGLNPEYLQEDISGWARSNSHIERWSRVGHTCIRYYPRCRCNVYRVTSLWFAHCRQLDNACRQTVMAETLVTASTGSLPVHRAAHAHLAHRNSTAMSVRCTIASPHGAQQAGEGRLSRERRNHGQGDDLEEPLHQLKKDYNWLDVRSVR